MNRRSFTKLLTGAPLCIHGWKLEDNPDCTPAPEPIPETEPVCHFCGEAGHEHQVNEIRPRPTGWDEPFGLGPEGRMFRMYCQNHPIDESVYEIIA